MFASRPRVWACPWWTARRRTERVSPAPCVWTSSSARTAASPALTSSVSRVFARLPSTVPRTRRAPCAAPSSRTPTYTKVGELRDSELPDVSDVRMCCSPHCACSSSELNHTVKTFFPKVYHGRQLNFRKARCAKWPLPSGRKWFRSFWGKKPLKSGKQKVYRKWIN